MSTLTAQQVIKRPLITEKSAWEGESRNRYSFLVDMRARKPHIREAIEQIYKVRVEKVSTQVRKGRTYRTRHGIANTGDWKKATVQLHKDDRIDLF
jgi:large subunit ribosomal protein L23